MIQTKISAVSGGKSASKQIDPRVVAVGQAMLTIVEGIDAMRPALLALGVEPDPIMEALRQGYRKTSDQIDRALSGLPRP